MIAARFAEDLHPNPCRLRFLANAPDRDFFRVGVVGVFAHGVSGFFSVDAIVAHLYVDRCGAAIGVRRAF